MLRNFKKIICVILAVFVSLMIVSPFDISAKAAESNYVADNGYEFVAENKNFVLFANKSSGQFYITDKATQVCWYSNPALKEEDATSAVFKMEQSSLLLINSYDKVSKILSKSSSEAMSVRKSGTTFKLIDNGFEIVYNFPSLEIEIPLQIILNDDGFNASVPVKRIKENSDLFGLSLLPYFSAGYPDETGYALLPDGSGSIMYFNNHRTSADDYRVELYGRDALSSAVTKPNEYYNANMPIFGIKKSNSIAFAIIEKGAAQAAVNALPNEKNTPYAICYADFALRGTDTVVLGENTGSAQSYMMYQEDDISIEGIDIRYILLADSQADYNTMAQLYRNYLTKEYKLEYKDKLEPNICLEFYGAVKKKKSFLGIPYTATQKLSTISDVSKIVEALNDDGIDGIQLVLQQWTKQQLSLKADGKLSLIRGVGSKKQLSALVDKLNEQGGNFYPAVTFQSAAKSGSGYSTYRNTIRNLSNMPAGKYTFKKNTLIKDNSVAKKYFLRLSTQKSLLSKIVKSANKYDIEGLALDSLEIYTDYASKTVSRSDSMRQLSEIIGQTAKQKQLAVANPADYAFSSVDFAYNVPTRSNGYSLTDESVPFYQLVVSGLFSYCGEPINLKGDRTQYLLECLESGSLLHYSFITEDNTLVKGTDLDWLYSANFEKNQKNLTDNYEITKQLFNATEGSRMVQHTKIADGVACVTYKNGARVYVNYNDTDYEFSGLTVASKGYLICKAGESANE